MKQLAIIISFLIISFSTYCQDEKNISKKSYDGTYQIQVINSRSQPSIPENLEELIDKNRDQTITRYISLGTEVRLKILSLEEISLENFKPIEKIVFVTE